MGANTGELFGRGPGGVEGVASGEPGGARRLVDHRVVRKPNREGPRRPEQNNRHLKQVK